MRRITAVPALAVLFAAACGETTTGPVEPKDVKPLLQSTDSDFHCIGTNTGTFQNVIVPSGTFCFLFNSTLTGNLKILPRAEVTTFNNTIAGDIQADKALFVDLVGDHVGGNIEIVDGDPTGSSQAGFLDYRVLGATVSDGNIHVIKNQGSVFVQNNILVKGNIKVEDNLNLDQLIVHNNQVPQNIQVFKNKGAGPKVVFFNIAGQAVQCFENDPPFTGVPNTAPTLEGQCGVPPTPF
jgi:hypothetical protein